jgi:hypothetical protein
LRKKIYEPIQARQSAENRLKKKGVYFSMLAPSFSSDLSAAFTLLK